MNNYILIEWPESQSFMEESWFEEEAILHPDLPSAYFIPEKYLLNNEMIVHRIKELIENYV